MKRPYTPAQIIANLRIFADNLKQPPSPNERAWMRAVITDITARGIALEGADAILTETLETIIVKAARQQANGGDIYDFQDRLRESANIAKSALNKVELLEDAAK